MRLRSLSAASAVVCTLSSSAIADDAGSPLTASIICEAPPAPGRFRCDVEGRLSSGSFSWADVVVVKVDDLILPLRGRLAPSDATTRAPSLYRFSLGFVAKARGTGDVLVRVRGVVCTGEVCDAREAEVLGHVVIGR
jgi:hypothetical protein